MAKWSSLKMVANFSELQAELAAGRQERLVLYAFDLLWRDGDVRTHPQIARKAALANFFVKYELEAPALYSEHLIGDGQKMFEHAAKLNWEGIVSKRADAPYNSERGEAWLKVKTVHCETLPVIGVASPPCILENKTAKSFATWARSAPDGRALRRVKFANSLTPSLVRSRG
jgi:ATP-dependent DNA ligase